MFHVLVTGGAGFIGSHLAGRLVSDGHLVRVLDNLSTGQRRNLDDLTDKFEFVEGDLRDVETCERACRGIDFVFHEAAMGSVPKSIDDPQTSHDVNMNGMFNILRAAAGARVRRLIYAGSSSVYGDSAESPKHEGLIPRPLSPYAVQKLAGEYYCSVFTKCFGMDTITLRYFNVFGARQNPASQYAAAIPAFVTAILRGEPPTVYGDGEQSRDFTYIDNVVEANMLAMHAKRTEGAAVNIACGGRITINQVLSAINDVLGAHVTPRHVAPRAGDVRHSCADIRLAQELLGYRPTYSFEEGLRRSIEYYRNTAW